VTHSKPKELIRVKQLLDVSKLDDAEQLIKNFEEKEGHTLHDKVLCNLLKCELLHWRGLYEHAVKLAEQTYKESLGLGNNILSVDILLRMADALIWPFHLDKAQDTIKQGEELLKSLTQELPTEYKQREAYIAYLKGWVYTRTNHVDQAIKQFELSISLRKELGVKLGIALSLGGIGEVFMVQKSDIDRATKYLEQGLAFAKESGNRRCIGYLLYDIGRLHSRKGELDRSIKLYEQSLKIFNDLNVKIWVARVLNALGIIYAMRGELNRSIRYYKQSLDLYNQFNNKVVMANILNNLSASYRMKGELDLALECLERCMALDRELGDLRKLANNHDFLIQILIDRGDFKQAKISLSDLEQLNIQLKDKEMNWIYLLNKAQVLKTNSRALNRGKAEKILKQLLEVDLHYAIRLMVLLNLCELLLTDFQITNDVEILEEIKPLITQLLDFSERSHSFWILGETYLLQAKLALINLEIKKARQLLTQAQKIAESYGINRLAMQISHEHDKLLKQIKLWEKLKELDAPLSERWKLASINEQIEKMVRRRMIEPRNLSEEDPVMLLILTEGGNLLFSKKFISDFNFEDDILGGFLTTINYFIVEVFSEGLDRAVFGQYTLLMMPLQPFLICYIFKGDSYYAHQKIKNFVNSIQNDMLIKESLQNFFQKSKSVQLSSIPSLESLITEIFVEKKK
jgi:tetratricopeptide (TPR) repeat protein